jgi:hypothetical protein
MATGPRNIVQFKSAVFNVTQVQPHFINDCCFGEDVALWLRPQLQQLGYEATEPGQEDWGWHLDCTRDGVTHTLNIGGYDDESGRGEWRIIVERNRSLKERILGRNQQIEPAMARALHSILTTAPETTTIEWYREDSRGKEMDRGVAPEE